MKREVSCRLSGPDVVQTTSTFDDDGKLQSENVLTLGDRESVLGHLEAQVSEAARDRDGIASPASKKPVPGDGKPGEEVLFWLQGNTIYRVRIRRDRNGKFQGQETSLVGSRRNVLENAEERLAELTHLRDAVKSAK